MSKYNPEKYNPENRRRYYLKNKNKVLEYSKEYSLKRKFNLSKEEYNTLLEKQNGVCSICKNPDSRALAVDHCHITGIVRGLLCSKCNRGIGYLNDDLAILEEAVKYLRKFSDCN